MIHILLSNASNLAIYEQIINQLKDAIINHDVQPGEALPSIRALAQELQISVITTKRAYEELESEGLIFSKPGRGFYVSENRVDMIKEKRVQMLETQMQELIRECKNAGLSKEDMFAMLEVLYE